MKIPGIPAPAQDPTGALSALKEAVEILTGRRGQKIAKLDPTTATLPDAIAKLNEVIDRLQGT